MDYACLACGAQLHPVPDTSPLLLHCGHGDFFTLDPMLSQIVRREPVELRIHLANWEDRSDLLRRLARRAFEKGQPLVAADFRDAAVRIDERAERVRRLLPSKQVQLDT